MNSTKIVLHGKSTICGNFFTALHVYRIGSLCQRESIKERENKSIEKMFCNSWFLASDNIYFDN